MQTQPKIEITYELKHDLKTVYNNLLDLKKFGKFHPHMKSVTVIKTQPEFIEYTIKEEILLFGFIKNYPVYDAKAFEIEKGKHIQYTSLVKPFIFLTVDFKFNENKNGSVTVNESIELKCNKLMAVVFGGILKKAHAAVFENMAKDF